MSVYRVSPLSLGLGGPVGAGPTGAHAVEQRLALVLGTRPGSLPWRPEFGCEVWRLMGQPASEENLKEASRAIKSAVERWVRGVRVLECHVSAVPFAQGREMYALRQETRNPLESGLLSLGVSAELEVDLVLKTRGGRLVAHLSLDQGAA